MDIEIGPHHRTKQTKKWNQFVAASDKILEGCEELLEKHNLAMIEGVSDEVSRKVQLSITFDTLRGSIDTVSYAIAWLMIELAGRPELQERIYQETRELLSNDRSLSYKDVQTPFLKACIKELFRIRPFGLGFIRTLSQDATIASGYHIPAGKSVFCSSLGCDDYFENPEEFIPERWMENREVKCLSPESSINECPMGVNNTQEIVKNKVPKFAVLPFGHGPRSCIGRRIAENLMIIFMMKLVNKYYIHPMGEFETYFNVFVKPKGQLNVKLEQRK